ncbi:ABC transporter substrate-binding protein [Treponema zioleckii]|uniref:ABC transporter substrate-binding protein n=1 Tax=Treponema zioleckii TaxID=331680 RepID=UPI00168AAB48|nr:sugar ABC transporter substrate-binding protein [Treponema zioleckii]
MKKILATVMAGLAVCGLSMFTGCNNKEKAQKESGPVTLKWALWDWDATAYYKPLIEAYNTTHPDVKIEPLDLGSSDYQTMLSIQLTGGDDSIDVVTVKDIPGYNTLQKAGQLVNLNDFIKEKGIDTSLYGGTTEQITVNGNLYALPFRSDFWVVFYNKDLFDKAGVPYPTNDMTFSEYDALARKMTSGSGAEKVYGAHYHTWRSAVQLFGVLDGKNTIVGGKYDFLKPYYETILKQQNDGIVQSYAQLKTTSTHYSGVFYNNSVAMLNMGSWFIGTLIQKVAAGEALSKNWGIVKYPHPDGVPAGTTLGTITSLGVSAASKKKEAALDFVRFVTGPEGAEVIAKTGTFPAIKNEAVIKTISGMAGFPQDENSAQALGVTKTYLEMPLHEKAAEIEVVLNQQHDNIMTENVSIDEGLKEMEKGVSAIIK